MLITNNLPVVELIIIHEEVLTSFFLGYLGSRFKKALSCAMMFFVSIYKYLQGQTNLKFSQYYFLLCVCKMVFAGKSFQKT